MRQHDGVDGRRLVRGLAFTHPRGPAVLPYAAGWDQLIYAASGVMSFHADGGVWVVPPDRAVWVPVGLGNRVEMGGRTAIRTLYFPAGLAPLPPAGRCVNVPPLLRELILHAVRACPLDLRLPQHHRLVGVLLDQLAVLPAAPLQLPLPTHPPADPLPRHHAARSPPLRRPRATGLLSSAKRADVREAEPKDRRPTAGRPPSGAPARQPNLRRAPLFSE